MKAALSTLRSLLDGPELVVLINDQPCCVGRNPWWYYWPRWYGVFPFDRQFISAFTLWGLVRKLEARERLIDSVAAERAMRQ